jgi:hypothetical protein
MLQRPGLGPGQPLRRSAGRPRVEGLRWVWLAFACAFDVRGAQPLGAQIPGMGGHHEGPARVERQPVHGEAVDGRIGLVGVDYLA